MLPEIGTGSRPRTAAPSGVVDRAYDQERLFTHLSPTEALTMGRALPFHPVNFKKGALELSFFSMIISVGAPLDITAQELRIEAFFPANAVTEAFAQHKLRGE